MAEARIFASLSIMARWFSTGAMTRKSSTLILSEKPIFLNSKSLTRLQSQLQIVACKGTMAPFLLMAKLEREKPIQFRAQ